MNMAMSKNEDDILNFRYFKNAIRKLNLWTFFRNTKWLFHFSNYPIFLLCCICKVLLVFWEQDSCL